MLKTQEQRDKAFEAHSEYYSELLTRHPPELKDNWYNDRLTQAMLKAVLMSQQMYKDMWAEGAFKSHEDNLKAQGGMSMLSTLEETILELGGKVRND